MKERGKKRESKKNQSQHHGPEFLSPPDYQSNKKKHKEKGTRKVSLAQENKGKGAKKDKVWKLAPPFPPQSPSKPKL